MLKGFDAGLKDVTPKRVIFLFQHLVYCEKCCNFALDIIIASWTHTPHHGDWKKTLKASLHGYYQVR